MNMDEVWFEVWVNGLPYFWGDDGSPYKYEAKEDAEGAIDSIWQYPHIILPEDVVIKACTTVRISI